MRGTTSLFEQSNQPSSVPNHVQSVTAEGKHQSDAALFVFLITAQNKPDKTISQTKIAIVRRGYDEAKLTASPSVL